jgi:hypothetical protein
MNVKIIRTEKQHCPIEVVVTGPAAPSQPCYYMKKEMSLRQFQAQDLVELSPSALQKPRLHEREPSKNHLNE